VLLTITVFVPIQSDAQQNEPWRPDQLMEQSELANNIERTDLPKPLIISVGPAGFIKGSIEVGEVKEKKNIAKLKSLLKADWLSKNFTTK